jgi:SAM-dependent methyltransferase
MKTKLQKPVVSTQLAITNDVIGAWKSQILFTLHEFAIFPALEQAPQTVFSLASSLSLPVDPLRRLLNAAVAVGYLIKDGENYSTAPHVRAVMTKGSDGYLGNWLEMYAHWYKTFAQLAAAVRKGGAVEDANAIDDDTYHLTFINGMKDYAGYRGADILNHLDLSNVGTLLDVGCGPGIYTSMFCRAYPQLHCTCYDVPQALRLAAEYTANQSLGSRITFRPGNYKTDSSFGEVQYDVVFLSHVLHQENAPTCAEILSKAYAALKPGGIIIVQAMFLNDSGIGPVYASFHDLLCLLIFPGGKNYSFGETIAMLTAAGFTNVRKKAMSFFNVNGLVIGEKGLPT